MSLKQARDRRDEARKLVADGIDPSAKRKADKQKRQYATENSFEAVAREWLAKNEPNWATSHLSRLTRRLEKNVFPYIGSTPVSALTAPDLLAVVQRIENRGVLETARRVLATCGQIIRYAIATNRAVRDPSRDLKGALTPTKGTNFAAITDPNRLAGFLRTIRHYQGTPAVAAAIRFAPLVFVRPGELRNAKWADIDFDKRQWSFVLSKTEVAHIVPLSDQAVEILEELRPITGRSEFVFPNHRSPKHPMSDNAILGAMRRLDIPKEEMTGHGFRAMARTLLDEELGFSRRLHRTPARPFSPRSAWPRIQPHDTFARTNSDDAIMFGHTRA